MGQMVLAAEDRGYTFSCGTLQGKKGMVLFVWEIKAAIHQASFYGVPHLKEQQICCIALLMI